MSENYLTKSPFDPAVVGSSITIDFQVAEDRSGGGWGPKDISDARWSYKLRAWSLGDLAQLVIHATIAKHATTAADGYLDDSVLMGTTAYEALHWELVEIDNDNNDAASISGKRERRIGKPWKDTIVAAPVNGVTEPS